MVSGRTWIQSQFHWLWGSAIALGCVLGMVPSGPVWGQAAPAAETAKDDLPSQAQLRERYNDALQRAGSGDPAEVERAIADLQSIRTLWQQRGDRAQEGLALQALGFIFVLRGDLQQALTTYQSALTIYEELPNREAEAVTLSGMAGIYEQTGETQKAIATYEKSLAIARELRLPEMEATQLQFLGILYNNLGQTQRSIDLYQEALAVYETLGDPAGKAEVLYSLGTLYTELGQLPKGLEYLRQAYDGARNLPNQTAVLTRTLVALGYTYLSMGETDQGITYLQEAATLQGIQEDLAGQSLTLYALGGAYFRQGDPQKAIAAFEAVLEKQQRVGNQNLIAAVHFSLGNIYNQRGQYQRAQEMAETSLRIYQQLGDKGEIASTLVTLGSIDASLGDYQQALSRYTEAIALQREIGQRTGEAETLVTMADLYRQLGSYDLSLSTYQQALTIQRDIGNQGTEAMILEYMGSVQRLAQDDAAALKSYEGAIALARQQQNSLQEATFLASLSRLHIDNQRPEAAVVSLNQALEIYRQQKNVLGEASVLGQLGRLYASRQEYDRAVAVLADALTLVRTTQVPVAEANVLGNLGRVYRLQRNFADSYATLQQELRLRETTGDRAGQAESLYQIALVERDQNNLLAAKTTLERAIALVEELRTSVTSDSLRTSFFASKQAYYELYIDVLMQLHAQEPEQNYAAIALQTSERARARSLLDLLTLAQAEIREGVAPRLLGEAEALGQQIEAAEKQQAALLNRNASQAQLTGVQQEIDRLLARLQTVEAQIRATSPRYAALTQPQPLSLKDIQQQVLDDQTLLLQYSLGEDRSYLWVVSATELRSYKLPGRATLEATAQAFYREVQRPDAEIRGDRSIIAVQRRGSQGQESPLDNPLSQVLLGPIADQLQGQRLLIVADGALQYVPFAALLIPGKDATPLIAQHEVIHLPSASTLGLLRRETAQRSPAPKTLAIFADPVFTMEDERFQMFLKPLPPESVPDLDAIAFQQARRSLNFRLDRLPFTAIEAEKIGAIVPDAQAFVASGFAASRENVLDADLSEYRIVHFATHGLLNSENPELSGIVLSLFTAQGEPQNGFLRLRDIFNLKLPADLVVLSACETGLGQTVRGEGVVGLTRGFMYAGAPRVVVSLWSVDDEGTSELMSRFYRKLLQDRLTPAAALRAAQIEMSQDPQWRSPYYWAAFTLQGEWR